MVACSQSHRCETERKDSHMKNLQKVLRVMKVKKVERVMLYIFIYVFLAISAPFIFLGGIKHGENVLKDLIVILLISFAVAFVTGLIYVISHLRYKKVI